MLTEEQLNKLGYIQSKHKGYWFKVIHDTHNLNIYTAIFYNSDGSITFEGHDKFKNRLLKELEDVKKQ